jgi:RimJ/RimL family protein N-acetyltransferase
MTTPPASPDSPIVNLAGDLVALGPQRRGLADLVQRWLNDFAVLTPLGVPLGPLTYEAELRQFEATDAAAGAIWFTVYERAALRPLGIAGLRDIDHAHGTAEFVVFLGEKDCWGKGYGTETTRLLLDYGFTALGLSNIMLKVYAFNTRGIRAYRRAGFREIGRRRAAYRLAGVPHDVIYIDCLAAEFQSTVLRALLDFSIESQPPA